MPITPLHLGILAPINHLLPGKVNNLSFWLVTLWLDASAIAYYAFDLEMGEFHGPDTHSFIAAFALGGAIAVGGFAYFVIKSFFVYTRKNEDAAFAWVLGAFLGAFTHILLDAMVHSEMLPIHPLPGNPLYWGGMDIISGFLVFTLFWLIYQYVSYMGDQARKILAATWLRKR